MKTRVALKIHSSVKMAKMASHKDLVESFFLLPAQIRESIKTFEKRLSEGSATGETIEEVCQLFNQYTQLIARLNDDDAQEILAESSKLDFNHLRRVWTDILSKASHSDKKRKSTRKMDADLKGYLRKAIEDMQSNLVRLSEIDRTTEAGQEKLREIEKQQRAAEQALQRAISEMKMVRRCDDIKRFFLCCPVTRYLLWFLGIALIILVIVLILIFRRE